MSAGEANGKPPLRLKFRKEKKFKMKFFGHKKKHEPTIQFDPETQDAVIRSSICTGEKVAGHFTELMLIKSPADEKLFKETYGVENIRLEY